MRHEYLMSSKAGNPAKDFQCMNAPTMGPGIKSTGAYSILKVKDNKQLYEAIRADLHITYIFIYLDSHPK